MGSALHLATSQKSIREENWKIVTFYITLAPPDDLTLANRFSALQAEEEMGKALSEATESVRPEPHGIT